MTHKFTGDLHAEEIYVRQEIANQFGTSNRVHRSGYIARIGEKEYVLRLEKTDLTDLNSQPSRTEYAISSLSDVPELVRIFFKEEEFILSDEMLVSTINGKWVPAQGIDGAMLLEMPKGFLLGINTTGNQIIFGIKDKHGVYRSAGSIRFESNDSSKCIELFSTAIKTVETHSKDVFVAASTKVFEYGTHEIPTVMERVNVAFDLDLESEYNDVFRRLVDNTAYHPEY